MNKELFNYEVDGIKIVIPVVSKDPSDWLITKEEIYIPDKSEFIYNAFKRDFKDIDVKVCKEDEFGNITDMVDIDATSQLIYTLSSRSSVLNNWLANINIEYSRNANIPTFYKDNVEADIYEKVNRVIIDTNKLEAKRAEKLQEAAINYRNIVTKINKEYDTEVNKRIKSDKEIEIPVKILNLNSTVLPLSLQLAIEKYSPASDSSPTKKQYAREILVSFKKTLLALYKEKGENFDIDKVIREISPK